MYIYICIKMLSAIYLKPVDRALCSGTVPVKRSCERVDPLSQHTPTHSDTQHTQCCSVLPPLPTRTHTRTSTDKCEYG